MANTNFAALTSEQLTIWSRDFWRVARNMSFINQFAGSGSNAMVQRISELTQSEKGARAVLTLLADMTGDGIVGDNTLEGNEEALRAYDIVVGLDQLRFANRLSGRLADQKSVVNFREHSRDALAYASCKAVCPRVFGSILYQTVLCMIVIGVAFGKLPHTMSIIYSNFTVIRASIIGIKLYKRRDRFLSC